MKRIQKSIRQQTKFIAVWIIANFIGGFLVGYLEDNGWQFMATLFFSGAIVGSLQWIVLRWVGLRDWFWPLASAFGWIFGYCILVLLQPLVSNIVNSLWSKFGLWEVFWLNLINQPIVFSFMALTQASILSYHTRKRVHTFGVWLFSSLVGGAMNGAIGASLCSAICQILPLTLIGIVNGTSWAVYGIVTGVALCKIIRA